MKLLVFETCSIFISWRGTMHPELNIWLYISIVKEMLRQCRTSQIVLVSATYYNQSKQVSKQINSFVLNYIIYCAVSCKLLQVSAKFQRGLQTNPVTKWWLWCHKVWFTHNFANPQCVIYVRYSLKCYRLEGSWNLQVHLRLTHQLVSLRIVMAFSKTSGSAISL